MSAKARTNPAELPSAPDMRNPFSPRIERPFAIGDLNLLFAESEPNIKWLERQKPLWQNFLATHGMTL